MVRRGVGFASLLRLGAVLVALVVAVPLARAADTTVFAAASLTDALREASALWRQQGHPAPTLSFGASSTLAKQIAQGAPANLFASADVKWMDFLDQKSLIAAGTRRNLLGNSLVLIVPADRPAHVDLTNGDAIAHLLGDVGRLAVGDPAHVPAGLYAAQALRHLGVWDALKSRLAPAADVRSALLLVERGEAPAGIVYATDAAASRRVAVAGTFPADSHDPIVYPFAVVKAGDTPQARALLDFMAGPQAVAVFARHGFLTE
jgi:molybdate transport system substrate-binding protein